MKIIDDLKKLKIPKHRIREIRERFLGTVYFIFLVETSKANKANLLARHKHARLQFGFFPSHTWLPTQKQSKYPKNQDFPTLFSL